MLADLCFKSRWIIILSLLLTPKLAAEQAAKFQLGVDYQKVVKTQVDSFQAEQLDQLESVSHIELFYWIGCESCYQVEAELAIYLREHPEYTFRRTPLVARVAWREQAYLQAMIQQFPEQTSHLSIMDLYRQCLSDCQVFEKVETSLDWLFKDLEAEERPDIDYELIWQREKNYQKRADLFSISQVPTIIINETYQVNASQAKTAKRMIQILDDLLTRE